MIQTIDYSTCLRLMEKKGKELFGDHFRILDEDRPLITGLLAYFLQDADGAREKNLSLHKGILLTGPVGCGKTSLMTLLRLFQPAENRFLLKSCREVSFEFIGEGYSVIHKYSKVSFNSGIYRSYCFDDLGTESNLKFYGNECNVMAEILLNRYDLFVREKTLTHITTNLNSSEIESIYGSRVRSRMREMFNLISFHQNSMDKRS